jgi:hypothetical protein
MNLQLNKIFTKGNAEKESDVQAAEAAKKILGEKTQLVDSDIRDIASVIYKSLQTEGCESNQIISVSSELLNLVTRELGVKK